MSSVPVTWVTPADVAVALGLAPISADDDLWLARVTAAANMWAYRQRAENAYVDDPVVSPGTDVETGVIRYAEALYRSRGGGDGYASFDELERVSVEPPGGMAIVKRLLGVPRAGVA